MVDNPIQRGNWFASLRAWRALRKAGRRSPPSGARSQPGEPATRAVPGAVELSRLAMAAPLEE